MNFRYLLSRRLEECVIENMPASRELSLMEFLTEEAIKKFGIRAEIFDDGDFFRVCYEFIKKNKYKPESSETGSVKARIKKEEKIKLTYLESGIKINILNNSVLYEPDFKFTHILFIFLNKIIGFKQADFMKYFIKVLYTPEHVVIMPVILNSADLCGKTMYMFESEAREYLNFYYNKAKEYLNALKPAENKNGKNGRCNYCVNDGFPFAYFADCDKCVVNTN